MAIGPPIYEEFRIPVLTLEETVAEKLRTLVQRQRATDLSDLALALGQPERHLDRAHVREIAREKFKLVKQGDHRSRIEANIEALRAVYGETVPGLAPDAPSYSDARSWVSERSRSTPVVLSHLVPAPRNRPPADSARCCSGFPPVAGRRPLQGGTPDGVRWGARWPAPGGPRRKDPAMRNQPGPSDGEREERRERTANAPEAAEQLLTSDGWQRWVRVRSQGGLARLSLQQPTARRDRSPGRDLRRGLQSMAATRVLRAQGRARGRIVAPMPIKDRDQSHDAETRDTAAVQDGVRVRPVAGRRRSRDETGALGPPSEPLTGDSHAHLLGPMQTFTESLGFSVSFESIPGATGGWCDQKARRIVVDADQPANAQLGSSSTRRSTASGSGMPSMAASEPR